MPGPATLKMLLDLAQTRSDAAARRLGALNSQERSEQERLRELLGYRHDYQARLRELSKNGIEHGAWRNFLAFADKLDRAIAEQHHAVAHSRNRAQAGRGEWHAERRKLMSFDTLAQRHERAEAARGAKREQREQDEHAMRSHARRDKVALHRER